jgi:hypothetical protein
MFFLKTQKAAAQCRFLGELDQIDEIRQAGMAIRFSYSMSLSSGRVTDVSDPDDLNHGFLLTVLISVCTSVRR